MTILLSVKIFGNPILTLEGDYIAANLLLAVRCLSSYLRQIASRLLCSPFGLKLARRRLGWRHLYDCVDASGTYDVRCDIRIWSRLKGPVTDLRCQLQASFVHQ